MQNNINNKKVEKEIKEKYLEAEQIIKNLLNIVVLKPNIEIKQINNNLEGIYNSTTGTIYINKKNQKLNNYFSTNCFRDFLTHELTHHIQITENIYQDDPDYNYLFFKTVQKLKKLDLIKKLENSNYKTDIEISKKLEKYIDNKEIQKLKQSLVQKSINESLAYFIGNFALYNKEIDLCKKREKIFRFSYKTYYNNSNKQNLLKILEVIPKLNSKQTNSKTKTSELSFLLPLLFESERSKLGKHIIIISFIANDFNILKTSQFLFRPYTKVIEDLNKIKKSEYQRTKIIDFLKNINSNNNELSYDHIKTYELIKKIIKNENIKSIIRK